jgi:molybdopterin biosynthesis enzyme
MKNIVIIPTGNEVKEGIILDTDSPMIMQTLLKNYPDCRIVKTAPVKDVETAISKEITKNAEEGADLIVLIGGSGGGHRYSNTLGEDYTHTALMDILEEKHFTEIYGKNGHMWCKLICGTIKDTVVVNVPVPYAEAKAAIEAFKESYEGNPLVKVNKEMAKAVQSQYGS